MADFVAVIRRAVDGLSDNTPEMRVKVYERARGAVQRQLENMKPRPPETMLARQLEKLDAAIREVEAEHAEALALPGEPPIEAAVADLPEEPVHVPEERSQAAEPAEHMYEPPAREPTPSAEAPHKLSTEPVFAAHRDEPTGWHPAGEEGEPVEAWQLPHSPTAADAPIIAYQRTEEYHPAASHDEQVDPVHEEWPRQATSDIGYSVDEQRHHLSEVPVETATAVPSQRFVEEVQGEPLRADAGGRFDDVWEEPAAPVVENRVELETSLAKPASAIDDPILAQSFSNAPAAPTKMPPVAEAFAWEANAFDEVPPASAPTKPARPVARGEFDDVDLFSDVHGGASKAAPLSKNDEPGDGWRELRELAGYDKFAADESVGSPVPPDLDQVVASKLQGKSFRMEPKPRRFGIKRILLTLIGLAVLGGGGYAFWKNRDALNNMVTGLISAATKTATVVGKPTTPATPVVKASPTATPAATAAATPGTSTQPAAANAPKGTDVAALDNNDNTVNGKFTQRLMANGTEVDAGPAAVPGQPATVEGKSVAQQNVAASAAPPAAATPVPTGAAAAAPVAAATAAAQAAPAAPTVQADNAPSPAAVPPAATPNVPTATPAPAADPAAQIGAPEKMFLYEERLGQASPAAIVGAVTWSLVEEKGDDGRPSPSVQGSISVPERGLTAMVTFKRNSDPSLPASHVVEIVFSVPPNFEGGSIDSVQRIAMKATEQDRGDPLIAVPAKITDDFHMVALNDFPDARKTNLDLLKNRGWIDIPVTYRNGRRALLTMAKGLSGTDAFNKAITEWAALGSVSSQ
ncbi:hypothetical protein [Rhizobium tubonense]|uniref:Uncharacterized protein n=1 Tax=Rhizobium tubonense TaxID=484088 RepID=A0A2W4CMV2_9HYPH|nr:hypothetical protein [Rhizobium tubonense]PZM14049.1 hypothetical protein CPY51_14500 [Rhizobium tubonense]